MAKILITGTRKGIGYHATLLLARAGHPVVATMRNPGASDLEMVAGEAKLPVTVLELGVDDDASVADDEEWAGLSGLRRDEDYDAHVLVDTGVDPRSA